MSSKKSLRLEKLELRCTPTVVCNANPVYASECAYLGNLIPASSITDTAVKSGNWSDPATWSNGVPGNGANVWIPNGVTVTVDGQEPASLHSILDNGLLQFATKVNTSLLVDTIVVGTDNANGAPQGELDVGTIANPIQAGVTATITFADDGTLTQAWPNDPHQLARGLISMNTVSIVGATVTPYEQMTGATAGSTTITLASAPTGWSVGDTLLLPGSSPTANQDEQIKLQAFSGNTVTLTSPLVYSHTAPAGDPVYAADEARNVVFQSQNTTDYERFGAIMFMHTDQEVVENAAFLYLGRTNKSLPLGATNPDGTTNVDGRYGVHFHRDYWPGMTDNDPPILVSGNFEEGAPGWGYDLHSSNGDFEHNVAYDNNGAGFATQAGNEIGTFNANMAVRTTGVANATNYGVVSSRTKINDFGFTGSGFWMQSPSVAMTNNIALDDTTGFQFYNLSLTSPTLGGPTFNEAGRIFAWSGEGPTGIPLASFSGNTAANSTDGVELFWSMTSPPTPNSRTILDQFTAWDVTVGVDLGLWTKNMTVQNSSLTATPGGAGVGVRTYPGYSDSTQILNTNVVGFAVGTNAPTHGDNGVTGGYWDDSTAFEITQQTSSDAMGARYLSYSNPVFGPNVQTQYRWDPQNASEPADPNQDFMPQQVYINGVQQYFANQAADYVPFPMDDANVPAALLGLTNSQLLQQYGLATEGEIASQQPQPEPTYFYLKSPVKVSSPIYTLSYSTPQGVVTESSPVTLQPGWNLLTRTIDGVLRSWLVGYSDGSRTPPAQGGVIGYQVAGNLTRALPLTVTTAGSTTKVTATTLPGATLRVIEINNNGTLWQVQISPGNGLFIMEGSSLVKIVSLPLSDTYSLDVKLDASLNSLSVAVNGVQYL